MSFEQPLLDLETSTAPDSPDPSALDESDDTQRIIARAVERIGPAQASIPPPPPPPAALVPFAGEAGTAVPPTTPELTGGPESTSEVNPGAPNSDGSTFSATFRRIRKEHPYLAIPPNTPTPGAMPGPQKQLS